MTEKEESTVCGRKKEGKKKKSMFNFQSQGREREKLSCPESIFTSQLFVLPFSTKINCRQQTGRTSSSSSSADSLKTLPARNICWLLGAGLSVLAE